MDHISKSLQEVSREIQKMPEQKTSLQVLKKTLTPEENKVIELKYKSPQVASLSPVDLLLHGKMLLLKIHVITGWSIPGSDELMNILVDQFVKNLIEKFGALNVDEIEFAFRQHGTTMKDWGKAMNLNLIDGVLIKYTNDRFLLSQDEEKIKFIAPEQKIFTEEELDNSAREDAERCYQMFLKDIVVKFPQSLEPILLKDGLIKEKELVIDFFRRKQSSKFKNIYIQDELHGTE